MLILSLNEILSVFDQEQAQVFLFSGQLQSQIQFLHILLASEQSSQDSHGFRRAVVSPLPDLLHLSNIAICWKTCRETHSKSEYLQKIFKTCIY